MPCGKNLPIDAEFCQFCGAKQESTDSLNQSSIEVNPEDKPGKDIIFNQTEPVDKKTKLKKYWWIFALIGVLITFIAFSQLKSPSPSDVASDIKETLNNDNSLDVTSVKPDKESKTMLVYVKENMAVDDLYMGKTSTFKTVERTLLDLSEKYKDDESDDYDLSYIQILKPGTNDTILMSVDNGKIKYSVLDDLE